MDVRFISERFSTGLCFALVFGLGIFMKLWIVLGLVALVIAVAVFVWLSRSKKSAAVSEVVASSEHAVLLYLKYEAFENGFPINEKEVEEGHVFQEKLFQAIAQAGVGELDGDEWGMGECIVFMYGSDADELWETIEPILDGEVFHSGSYGMKRYGAADDEEALEVRIELD